MIIFNSENRFALDCTPEQAACLRRQFGGRRYARNWAVRTLKNDLDRYRETGRERTSPHWPPCASGGTRPRTPSAWIGRAVRHGGRPPSPPRPVMGEPPGPGEHDHVRAPV